MKISAQNILISQATLWICGIIVLFCGIFLTGAGLTERIVGYTFKTAPKLDFEKQAYYDNVLAAAQRAIALQPDNARHYVRKAEYLRNKIDDISSSDHAYEAAMVSELYEKALAINPCNYLYHLQAGLWHRSQGRLEQAGGYFKAAHSLYPQDYLPYFFLGQYYFQDNQPELGFSFLLQSFHRRFRDKNALLKELISAAQPSWGLVLEGERNIIGYTIIVRNQQFDLKAHHFPHEPISLRLRVYMGSPDSKPYLYCKQLRAGSFKKIDNIEGSVYEVVIDDFSNGTYLDDYWIQASSVIEKIEFMYMLYRA